MSALTRRIVLFSPLLLTAQAPAGTPANPSPYAPPAPTIITHRGFTADISPAVRMPNRNQVEATLKRQIDIVADCGAKADVMAFFQKQKILLKNDNTSDLARFSRSQGAVELLAISRLPEDPVLLRELLRGVHLLHVPDGIRNKDIERAYRAAQDGKLYEAHEQVMRLITNFFALTGCTHLLGKLAREPLTREKLRAALPDYAAWLGEVLGPKG